jgi:cell division protein ZipA
MYISPIYLISFAVAATLVALGLRKEPQTSNDFVNLEAAPPKPKEKPKPQLHCIYITFKQPVLGSDLFQYFMSHQLIFNDQRIFHCLVNGKTQFGIATLNAPGTFDLQTMNKDQFKGLTFFMDTSNSPSDIERFDLMCSALMDAKERFGGQMRTKEQTIDLSYLQQWREQLHEMG